MPGFPKIMAGELKNQRGENSIFQTCFAGDYNQVKTFVENNQQAINHLDEDGRTLLHWAISGNHLEIVNLLFDNNIKSNVKDDFGSNELMIACTIGSLALVKLLISKGIPSIPNNNKRTNLHYCASKGYLEIMDELLKLGDNVDQQDELGQTPLFRACGKGQMAVAKKLIENGSKVNVIFVNSIQMDKMRIVCT